MDHFAVTPDLVLEKIFGFLDCKDKLNVMTTCRRFNDTIKNTSALMNNIKLRINLHKTDLQMIGRSFRKYQHVWLETPFMHTITTPPGLKHLMDYLEKVGGNVRSLRLFRIHATTFLPYGQVQRLFSALPNLEKFEADVVDFSEVESRNIQISFAGLKHLSISQCDFHFPHQKFYRSSIQLESFKTDSHMPLQELENLKQFLMKQNRLKNLVLHSTFNEFFDEELLSHLEFQLTNFDCTFTTNYLGIMRFLKTQKYLEELTLNPSIYAERYRKDATDLLSTILDIQTLKKLTLVVKYDCFGGINPNKFCPYVEELNLSYINQYNTYMKMEYLDQLTEAIPNLKTLRFSTKYGLDQGTFDENDLQFLNKLKNLETLKMGVSKSSNVVKFLNLKNLKFLSIDCFWNAEEDGFFRHMREDDWIPFLQTHPHLKELHLKNILFREEIWRWIENHHENLEVISLNCAYFMSQHFPMDEYSEAHRKMMSQSRKFQITRSQCGSNFFDLQLRKVPGPM